MLLYLGAMFAFRSAFCIVDIYASHLDTVQSLAIRYSLTGPKEDCDSTDSFLLSNVNMYPVHSPVVP